MFRESRIDLVITDYQTVGGAGTALARHIKEVNDVPIILLTGHFGTVSKPPAVDLCLVKPQTACKEVQLATHLEPSMDRPGLKDRLLKISKMLEDSQLDPDIRKQLEELAADIEQTLASRGTPNETLDDKESPPDERK